MGPKQAWIAFSLLFVLADVVAMVALVDLGYSEMFVVSCGLLALLLYLYVIYKRYHVEVIKESDIKLFTEPGDLRILCGIYGLDRSGTEDDLRTRLMTFSKANRSRAFTWVAPRLVRSVTSALEIPEDAIAEDRPFEGRPLTGGYDRSDSRLSAIDACPVCGAKLLAKGRTCGECGADLEFYEVLRESRVGRQLVSEKKRAVRRKPSNLEPALEKKR